MSSYCATNLFSTTYIKRDLRPFTTDEKYELGISWGIPHKLKCKSKHDNQQKQGTRILQQPDIKLILYYKSTSATYHLQAFLHKNIKFNIPSVPKQLFIYNIFSHNCISQQAVFIKKRRSIFSTPVQQNF